jgi:arylsulfatase A-like enzyme
MKSGVAAPTGHAVPALALVSWFALCAAYLELAYMGWRKLSQHVVFASPHIVWMTPLGYLILFLPLVLVVVIVRRTIPASRREALLTFLLSLTAAFSVLSIFWVKLGPISVLLLSAGLAMQSTRTILAHPAGFARLVPRTLPWMMTLWLLAGLGLSTWRWYRERAAVQALIEAGNSPNVLLLLLDTVRAKNLSLYGYPLRTTPGLEHFGAGAVVFDRAYAAAPWTLPSIATIFTGRYPYEHHADWRVPLAGENRTLAEVFRDAGYITGGFVANQNYSSGEVGLGQGFSRFEDYTTSFTDILMSAAPGAFILNNPKLRQLIGFYDTFGRKNADRLNADFLAWLRARPHRPFFAYLNYYDAHEPYLPSSPFDTLFGSDSLRKKTLNQHIAIRDAHHAEKDRMSAAERAAEERAYDGTLAYIDSRIEKLLGELDRSGLGRNTIVIVTADHGELFGEHSLFTHGNSLYLPLLHVPLLIRAPDLPRGVRVATPVTLRDLARTILDLAGLDDERIPGASLTRLARGIDTSETVSPLIATIGPALNSRHTDPVFKGRMWSMVSPPYHYILGGDGMQELFHFVRDTAESVNLAPDSAMRPLVARLRAIVDSVRRK